ncbi:MAG: YihY/virulence factor BrkB family protein [Pirellulales bacterium]|nr:YihY/virulence factor BrkB family protein [Pirellulales bacterium]
MAQQQKPAGIWILIAWLKQSLWPRLWGTVQEWQKDDGGHSAAALAFYTAFSFFPLVLVLLSILGFFLERAQLGRRDAAEYLLNPIQEQVSPQLAQQLDIILDQVKDNAGVNGPVGFIILLFGAVGIFSQIEVVFARIWKEHLPPSDMRWIAILGRVLFNRLKAFLVILGLGLFISITFFSSVLFSTLGVIFHDWPMGNLPWKMAQFAIGVVLNNCFFLFLYRLFSPRFVWLSECWQGSFVASVLWEAGRIALTTYLMQGTYTAYGIVGSFIAVMLWFYYAWSVLFFGAEFAQVSCRMRRQSTGELAGQFYGL